MYCALASLYNRQDEAFLGVIFQKTTDDRISRLYIDFHGVYFTRAGFGT